MLGDQYYSGKQQVDTRRFSRDAIQDARVSAYTIVKVGVWAFQCYPRFTHLAVKTHAHMRRKKEIVGITYTLPQINVPDMWN
jgi:hypothetical protein